MAVGDEMALSARKITDIFSTIRRVVNGILAAAKLTVKGTKDAADTVKRTVRTTTGAVKKALASFDQIDRLDFGGGVSVSVTTSTKFAQGQKEAETYTMGIREMLEKTTEVFQNTAEKIRSGMKSFTSEVLGNAQTTGVSLGDIFQRLYSGVVVPFTQGMGQGMDNLWTRMTGGLSNFIGNWIPGFQGAISSITGFFRDGTASISGTVGQTQQTMNGLLQFLSGTFTGSWKTACGQLGTSWSSVWSGLPGICKPGLNTTVGMVNSALAGMVAGLNSLIQKTNGINLTLPGWSLFGSNAGKSWSPNIKSLPLPSKIPLLAQGAVLPANRPFLAMVGDQRHGTNIEAPLATITEAVSLSMQDFASSNLKGHEATVAVLREILEAVLGISIGDDVIAGAVDRYQRKMAVVRGGAL